MDPSHLDVWMSLIPRVLCKVPSFLQRKEFCFSLKSIISGCQLLARGLCYQLLPLFQSLLSLHWIISLSPQIFKLEMNIYVLYTKRKEEEEKEKKKKRGREGKKFMKRKKKKKRNPSLDLAISSDQTMIFSLLTTLYVHHWNMS